MNEVDYTEVSETYMIPCLTLPADARIPNNTTCALSRRVTRPAYYDGGKFHNVQTPLEGQAAFRWIAGHHLLFLMWSGLSYACEQAANALRDQDTSKTIQWMRRAIAISEGNNAVMDYSADFNTDEYQNLIRPGMERCRPDFAAGMSLESQMMARFLSELDIALAAAASPLREAVSRAMSDFKVSRKDWHKGHINIATRLQPDDETLKRRVENMEQEDSCPIIAPKRGLSLQEKHIKTLAQEIGCPVDRREYEANVIRSPEASRAYDDYFVIIRKGNLSPAEMLATIYQVMATTMVDICASNLRIEQRDALNLAVGTLVVILREVGTERILSLAA